MTQQTEERYCLEMITLLEREYHKSIEPYVQRLARLKSMETTFTIPLEQWEAYNKTKEMK